jgi:hypothetical protein
MKLKTQIAVIALALAVSTSLVSSQDRQSPQLPTVHPTIEGVWQVTRMGVNCNDPNQHGPPFPALMTFYRDGTLTAYANPPVRARSTLPRLVSGSASQVVRITPSTIYRTSMTKAAPLLGRG